MNELMRWKRLIPINLPPGNKENPDSDLPFRYRGGKLTVNRDVKIKRYADMPPYMIDDNPDNLKKLKAVKTDRGRNAGEGFTIQCSMFSRKPENAGVEHPAEEYVDRHVKGICTKESRPSSRMLPSFDSRPDFWEFSKSV
jgi:hypothetical protein